MKPIKTCREETLAGYYNMAKISASFKYLNDYILSIV